MVSQKHLPVVLGPVIPVLEIRVQGRFGVQIRRTPRYLATLLLGARVFKELDLLKNILIWAELGILNVYIVLRRLNKMLLSLSR